MNLINRIERVVQESGLGVHEFCKSISVTKSTYYNWKKGGGLNICNVTEILRVYSTYNPRWLLLGEEPVKVPERKLYLQPEEETTTAGEAERENYEAQITRRQLKELLLKMINDIDGLK